MKYQLKVVVLTLILLESMKSAVSQYSMYDTNCTCHDIGFFCGSEIIARTNQKYPNCNPCMKYKCREANATGLFDRCTSAHPCKVLPECQDKPGSCKNTESKRAFCDYYDKMPYNERRKYCYES